MSSAAAPRTPRALQTRLLTTVLALVLVAWGIAAALAWHETDEEVSDLLDAHLAQTAALLRLQPLDELDEDRLNEAPELDKHQRQHRGQQPGLQRAWRAGGGSAAHAGSRAMR